MGENFGLVGHPVSESLSPGLFSAAYDGLYNYKLLNYKDFDEAWPVISDGSFKAVNITAPHKEAACRKAVETVIGKGGSISLPCAKTGSANILAFSEDGGVSAFNSDFSGVITSVAEALFPGIATQFIAEFGERAFIKIHQYTSEVLVRYYGRQPQALVVGCGGAGKTAAIAAAELGYRTFIINRTAQKAIDFASTHPEYDFICAEMGLIPAAVKECELVIYTLPAAVDQLSGLDNGSFGKGKIILEANYTKPSFDLKLLNAMEECGTQYIPGRRWLFWQAASGYPLMTGKQCNIAAMSASLFQNNFVN